MLQILYTVIGWYFASRARGQQTAMATYEPHRESPGTAEWLLGLFLGLLAGGVLALLFAPKTGKEFQSDVKVWLNDLPDTLRDEMDRAKSRSEQWMDKTRFRIEDRMERYQTWRGARRQAKAKKRELEGEYDFI